MLIDIHSHLDMCKNIPKVVENARKNNVKIISCGVNIKSNRRMLEFSTLYNIGVCLGIYPIDALELKDEDIDSEINFIKKQKIIGIGEVGIDLKHGNNIMRQKEILEKFVLLAKEMNLPIEIHSRKAEKETVDFLEKFNYDKIIMHCFSGNMKLVRRIIDNNWYLSIPSNVKHSEHFQKVVEITPLENLFCETDSPFLHPDKKENNESSNVIESYKKIAEIKRLSLKEIEEKIEENYKRIFKE